VNGGRARPNTAGLYIHKSDIEHGSEQDVYKARDGRTLGEHD